MNKHQPSLTNPRDALHHGKGAASANKGGRAACDNFAIELSWQCLRRSTFRVTASYLSKVANFSLPHGPTCIWRSLGVTPFEFCRDLRHLKTTVPGLSCGLVCVILRLAVSVAHRLVTNRQTDTHTHNYGIYNASMASRGKTYLLATGARYDVTYMALFWLFVKFFVLQWSMQPQVRVF